ncbi:MAG TPA: hypothetical protein VL588_09755 [Bdellovibrionota bacterium]|nr:hypothetical protein [Bdellovibrionota bacterium]
MVRLRPWFAAPLLAALSGTAHGIPTLPYTTRSIGYSGWSDAVRGDIPEVGMAGAMVGLCPSFVSCLDNPAGLALTQTHPGLEITHNIVYDGQLQDGSSPVHTTMEGATFSHYPWGISMGAWEPHREGQDYLRQGTGDQFNAEVLVREYHLAVAHVFMNNHLAVGLDLTLAYGRSTLDFASTSSFKDTEGQAFAFSGGLGLQYRLPHRWILGWSYHLPMALDTSKDAPGTPGITGFHKTLHVPFRLSVGGSYIPNRYFQFGAGFYYIGPVKDAAFVEDEVPLGERMNLQPRVGASYTFLDLRELDATVSLGTYLEVSRSEVTPSRMHLTSALSVNPWVLNFGWGIDIAPQYRNYLVSFGVDVMELFEKMGVLPRQWHPPHAGLFPRMAEETEEGLPRPLVDHWVPHKETDLLKEGKKIPRRLEESVKDAPNELKNLGTDLIDAVGSVVTEPLKKKKAAPKKKPTRPRPDDHT